MRFWEEEGPPPMEEAESGPSDVRLKADIPEAQRCPGCQGAKTLLTYGYNQTFTVIFRRRPCYWCGGTGELEEIWKERCRRLEVIRKLRQRPTLALDELKRLHDLEAAHAAILERLRGDSPMQRRRRKR